MTGKPLLILGSLGQVGRAWCHLLTQRQTPFVAIDRQQVDLTETRKLARLIQKNFAGVVNCAAYTDVDGAEVHAKQAMAVNARGVAVLARRCARVGLPLVHYSTDYVFDGCAQRPYATDAATAPLNVYGQSKLAGEQAIIASGGEHLIVRTSWVYAPWGNNFVRTMVRLCQQQPSLRVVSDQYGRPTSSEHLARCTLGLLEHGCRGVWHVTDGGSCNWHQFAATIVNQVNPACPVLPCQTTDFPRPARRPMWSLLDISQTEQVLGPMPPWRDHLRGVLDRLEPSR